MFYGRRCHSVFILTSSAQMLLSMSCCLHKHSSNKASRPPDKLVQAICGFPRRLLCSVLPHTQTKTTLSAAGRLSFPTTQPRPAAHQLRSDRYVHKSEDHLGCIYMYIYVSQWVRKQHIFIPWGGGKNKSVSLAACVYVCCMSLVNLAVPLVRCLSSRLDCQPCFQYQRCIYTRRCVPVSIAGMLICVCLCVNFGDGLCCWYVCMCLSLVNLAVPPVPCLPSGLSFNLAFSTRGAYTCRCVTISIAGMLIYVCFCVHFGDGLCCGKCLI